MTLPERGWKGYGRPGYMPPAAKQLRAQAIANDDAGHDLREHAFACWRSKTVFPQAVNRWISEIGGRTK